MTGHSQKPFVKLQSGERLYAVSEESLPEILEKLHPEYNAGATFHLSEEEWVSVHGCISEGFVVSFKSPGSPDIAYCPKMMSAADVQRIVSYFLRGDPNWKEKVPWKREKPIINRIIVVVVIAVVFSIVVSLAIDLLGWW